MSKISQLKSTEGRLCLRASCRSEIKPDVKDIFTVIQVEFGLFFGMQASHSSIILVEWHVLQEEVQERICRP